jgi:hypothetical protein
VCRKKGRQVEAKHDRGQMLMAVAEVVLDMVTSCGEDVVPLIFMLPACATGMGHLFHLEIVKGLAGDKAVVIEAFT